MVGNGLMLDFTDLLPNAAQIESFNHHSTGNTPIMSHMDLDDDEDVPAMSACSPAQHCGSGAQAKLIEWFDSLFSDREPMRPLNSEDFSCWKQLLQNFSHEEYCDLLLHAANEVSIAKSKLGDLYTIPRLCTRSMVADSLADCTEVKGLATGMPLIIKPWKEVKPEMVKRMTTMAVKSGILQACKALHSVDTRISNVQRGIEKSKMSAKDASDPQQRANDGRPDYINAIGRVDFDADLIESRFADGLQKQLDRDYCIERRFKSEADRDFVLSHPEGLRDYMLAQRDNGFAWTERMILFARQGRMSELRHEVER